MIARASEQKPPVAPSSSPVVVSVVLATLNERPNLPEVIARILRQSLPPTEILVVDDGSVDGTREYVEEFAARDPRVRLILHQGKQTTLRAQCQGIELARGSLVVVMDADLQHPPEILGAMVAGLQEGAALVVASGTRPEAPPESGRRSAGSSRTGPNGSPDGSCRPREGSPTRCQGISHSAERSGSH